MKMKTSLLRPALSHCFALLLLAVALTAVSSHAAIASPPQYMAYQSYLTDQNGNPLGSTNVGPKNYNVVFRIWDSQTGGNELDAEQQTVTINNGYFSVLLGQGSAYSTEIHTNALSGLFTSPTASSRYVEMTVLGIGAGGINVTILPRAQLLTSPYAFLAANAVNAATAGSLVNSGSTATVVTVTNGSVGIGAVTPGATLEVNGTSLVDGLSTFTGNATFNGGIYLPSANGFHQTSAGPFYVDAAGTVGGRFTINTSGQVGIGNNSPGFPLNFASVLGDKISLYDSVAGGNSYGFGVQGGTLQIHTDSSVGGIAFGYGSSAAMTDTMVVNGNGNVGIGTTNPNANLEVNGTAQVDNTAIFSGFATFNGGISVGSSAGFEQTSAGSFYVDAPNVAGGRFFINTSGLVGIGTTAPTSTLSVNGGEDVKTVLTVNGPGTGTSQNLCNLAVAPAVGNYSTAASTGDTVLRSINGRLLLQSGGLLAAITIGNNNNVGIGNFGTASPGQAPLVVAGTGNNSGSFQYFNISSGGSVGSGTAVQAVSIFATGDIASQNAFIAYSDARIKNIVGLSDGAHDLNTLMGIKVTDFTYRDLVQHHNGPVKKVIAQQVEQVYPQAVSKSTEAVPDIYKTATVQAGWVQLATDLKVGERVKLIGEKDQGIHEVLEVRKDGFRTDFKPEGHKVFVYGREVKDFRSVDYDAIAMLNVSATQELARRLANVEQREAHLADLEQKAAQVTTLAQEVADLKKMVQQLASAGKSSKLTADAAGAEAAPAKLMTTASLDR